MIKLIVTSIFAAFCSLSIFAQEEISHWVLAYSDEFDGTEIDKTRWFTALPWGHSLTHYHKEDNIVLDGSGILKLRAVEEDWEAKVIPWLAPDLILSDNETNLRTFQWTTGMIMSKQKFKHGKFQIRFKCTSGKGYWPAFWLFGEQDDEIDIFELVGDKPTEIQTDLHCFPDWTPNDKGDDDCAESDDLDIPNWSQNWNEVEVEWTPQHIKWRINGQEKRKEPNELFEDPKPFFRSMWIIISHGISINDDEGALFSGPPDETTPFPGDFEVDYVRVWKKCGDDFMSVCNYHQNYHNDPSNWVADEMIWGGNNCNIHIDNTPHAVNDPGTDFVNLIATERITLRNGFTADPGSRLHARIGTCVPMLDNGKKDEEKNDSKTLSLNKNNEVNHLFDDVDFLVRVFPNPSEGLFNVEFSRSDENSSYQIKDELGRIILSNPIHGSTVLIDMNGYSKGIYFLSLKFYDQNVVRKIILD